MRGYTLLILFILSVAGAFEAGAQVNFQFVPEIQGRNVDGLFNARIYTPKGKRNVALTITVTERKKGRVLTIVTPPFSINPGSSAIPVSAVRPAKLQFANNAFSSQVQQTGMLPEGDYEYCYSLSPELGGGLDPESPAEQCYSAELTPFSPLNLSEPYNEEKICVKRPLFTWQPSFPAINGAAYQLILTEIKERQTATEAINYNLPLISQNGIVTPALPFPPSYKELKPGKKYAWQVSLYKNQTVLNRSEIWEFMVDCQDSVEAEPSIVDQGYRTIEDLSKGNFYVANGMIRFSITNPYDHQQLNYSITHLNNGKQKIEGLPRLHLQKGENFIILELSGIKNMKDSEYYVLNIVLPDGGRKSLRFLFMSEK